AGGALERARGVLLGLVVAQRGEVDARLLEIGADADARQGDEADSRVVNLASDEVCQLGANLIGYTLGTRTLRHYAMIATRSIAKTSMTSPTLMSLNFSKPMPHSRPAFTSPASSLKRRSEPILPS